MFANPPPSKGSPSFFFSLTTRGSSRKKQPGHPAAAQSELHLESCCSLCIVFGQPQTLDPFSSSSEVSWPNVKFQRKQCEISTFLTFNLWHCLQSDSFGHSEWKWLQKLSPRTTATATRPPSSASCEPIKWKLCSRFIKTSLVRQCSADGCGIAIRMRREPLEMQIFSLEKVSSICKWNFEEDCFWLVVAISGCCSSRRCLHVRGRQVPQQRGKVTLI